MVGDVSRLSGVCLLNLCVIDRLVYWSPKAVPVAKGSQGVGVGRYDDAPITFCVRVSMLVAHSLVRLRPSGHGAIAWPNDGQI